MYWASIGTVDLMTFAKFEVLLGRNNSRILAGTYYSQNYSRIIGTGLAIVRYNNHSVMHARGDVCVYRPDVFQHVLHLHHILLRSRFMHSSGLVV